MCIGNFCNRNVVCARRDMTVVEAANLMRRHHVGNVVVAEEMADGQRPVGIVTDRDIVVEVVSAGLDPGLVKLGDLVLQPVVTVDDQTGYADTIRLMSARGIRRLPVVNKVGLLVGIVSFDDLLHQLAVPLSELSEIAGREWRLEAQTRK